MAMKMISLLFGLLFYYGIRPSVAQQVISIPSARQRAFQEAEVGVLISYDLHVFDGKKYEQGKNRITPVADYNIFHPAKLNTDQWIQAAKAAGAGFAVLTVTHETGFALYPSDVNPYCMKALKWKDGRGDIVRDFVNSCRKYGLKPGVYVGIRWNSFLGVHNFKVEGEGSFRENRQQYYNRMCEGMVKELCTRYGPLFMCWFDGGADDPARGAPDVLPVVRKYQPDCLFYHNARLAELRWGGSETGTVGYPCWSAFPYPSTDVVTYPEVAENGDDLLKHGDPDGKYYIPAMADVPLRGYNGRHEWFWEPGDDAHLFPLTGLMKMYYRSVGRNATLILGLTPDTAGLLPEADVERLREFGATVRRRFAHPLAAGQGEGSQVTLRLRAPQKVNQVMIGENIAKGERIRKYKVEALVKGRWKTVCEGSSVGHKRIQVFDPVQTRSLKLVVEKSAGKPVVRFFNAYYIAADKLTSINNE